MNLRPAGYWLLLVTCTLTWPGCAQPLFNRQAADSSSRTSSQVSRPESQEGPVSLARLIERSGQTEQAQRMYLALIEKQPENSLPYHRLGVMAAQDKKWRIAEQYFNQAYALDPSSTELLSDMGYFYYLQNRNQEAENILRQALGLNADHKAASNNLGLVLGGQERFDESLDVFRRAGSEAEARANLAFVLAQQGQRDHALEAYSKALSLDPKMRPAAMAMLQLAQNRPRPPANPATGPAQLTTDEQLIPQRPNNALPAETAAVVASDPPIPAPPAMAKAVTPAVVAQAADRPPHPRELVHDGEVVLAHGQHEHDTSKQPRELAQRRDDRARSHRDQVPELATHLTIRQEPSQVVPEIARDAEPTHSLHESQRPDFAANGRHAPQRRNDEAVQAAKEQLVVSDAPIQAPHAMRTAVTRTIAARADSSPPHGGKMISDRDVVLTSGNAAAPLPPSRTAGQRPELANNKIVRQETPEYVVPEIIFNTAPTSSSSTSPVPEISANLGRLGIEP